MENKLPEEYQAVYNVIASNKEKYITKNMILVRLGKGQSYKRKLEQIIYDLVVKYKSPIGSSSAAPTKGFFIISNKNDMYIAKRDISSRTSSMNLRYEALDNMDI